MTINGSKSWSKVVEIPAAEMPPPSVGSGSRSSGNS